MFDLDTCRAERKSMRVACMGDAHYSGMKWKNRHYKLINHALYEGVFREFFRQEADLYLSLGDLTNFGTKKEFEDVYGIIQQFNKPFVQVVGNHDLVCSTKQEYQRYTGMPLYWSESHDDCHLIFLDSCRQLYAGKKSGQMSLAQVEFLKRELERAGDKLAIVFAHHPIQRIQVLDEDGKEIEGYDLKEILKQKPGKGVYVNGHLHRDHYHTEGNWGFFQFNSILDEPTVRIIEVKDGVVSLETHCMEDKVIQKYATKIAKACITYQRRENDEEFVNQRDFVLHEDENLGLVRVMARS